MLRGSAGTKLPRTDSVDSAALLMLSFLACLGVAGVAKATGTAGDGNAWFFVLLAILVATSVGQGLITAIVNGAIVSLFDNFFFSSHGGELSFATWGSVRVALALIVVAAVASLGGRLAGWYRVASRAARRVLTDKAPYRFDDHER